MGIRKLIKKKLENYSIKKKYGHFITKKTIKKDWPKKHLNRTALINAAVTNILKHKKTCFYLEIGCNNNETFNSISLPPKYKYGVDPVHGGNIKKTSDNFFNKNKRKFDVIFVDGLHEYSQCQRDVINSLKFLNKNGFLLMHDLIPLNWEMEFVPRIKPKSIWNGDVWKVGYELSKSSGFNFFIADIDNGVGFLQKKNIKYSYKKMNLLLKDMRFKYFLKIYKKFKIKNGENALKIISNG